MKLSDELKAKLENLKDESKLIVENASSTAEEITAKTEEIVALKAKIELQEKTEEEESDVIQNQINLGKGEKKMNIKDIMNKVRAKEVLADEESKELANAYKKAFFNAFRKKATEDDVEVLNALSETGGSPEGATGGFLVPQDIQTKINEFKRSLPQLEALVNVEQVGTLSGSRVFETIATMSAFANITDFTADIAEEAGPSFETVTYAIKDYAGFLPVPNDLLQDSDQAIEAYLVKWLGRKSVVTRNTLIAAILTALTPVTFADYKAIKKAINKTLDPMIAAQAIILTNQDGFQYLDTLEDGEGRPILQVDVTKPSQKLFAGKTVVVMPNTVLATTGTSTKLAPMFVGSLVDLVTMFERKGITISSTNIGGTAFRKNRTELRAIEREDVKAVDTSAVVYGKIDVTAIV